MTSKEKAQELVDKYMNIKKVKLSDYSVIFLPTAKQCALIAVDEILSIMNRSIQHFVPHFGGDGHTIKMPNQEYEYWKEVKQEIEKL